MSCCRLHTPSAPERILMIDRAKAVYNFYQCNGPLIPRSLKLRQGDPLLRFESRSNYRSARFDFKQSFLKKAAFGIIRYQFKSAAVAVGCLTFQSRATL